MKYRSLALKYDWREIADGYEEVLRNAA